MFTVNISSESRILHNLEWWQNLLVFTGLMHRIVGLPVFVQCQGETLNQWWRRVCSFGVSEKEDVGMLASIDEKITNHSQTPFSLEILITNNVQEFFEPRSSPPPPPPPHTSIAVKSTPLGNCLHVGSTIWRFNTSKSEINPLYCWKLSESKNQVHLMSKLD